MALIDCPQCKKKISDKAKECSHCGLKLSGLNEDEVASIKRIANIKQAERLMNHSMIAVLLFCAGFGFMYWGEPQAGSWQHNGAIGMASVGFVWYILNRIRIIWLKRK